jgi:Protein of unknown function (DUF1203)
MSAILAQHKDTTSGAELRFAIEALPTADLDDIRQAGRDRYGNPLMRRVVGAGDAGSPLRCCLREAAIGEQIVLIAHSPRGGTGVYREVGPVFIHADKCAGYLTPGQYPDGFRHRQQVFRAYDSQGRICDAILVNGIEAEEVIADLLARRGVAVVQSRNLLYGCFMFLISRAGLAAHAA